MKGISLLAVALTLSGCATITPYSGPSTTDTAAVTLAAHGLQSHVAMQDDSVVVHILRRASQEKLGSIKFLPGTDAQNIKLDRGQEYTLRFMSIQPHFGGQTSCNLDVPFSADDHASYDVKYSALKPACTISVARVETDGSRTIVFDQPGVPSEIRIKVNVSTQAQ